MYFCFERVVVVVSVGASAYVWSALYTVAAMSMYVYVDKFVLYTTQQS